MGNYYQPNMNFQYNNNLNLINSYNNINYFNSNNQNNNKIEKSMKKSEILKILKRAQFKLSDFSLSKLKNDIAERNLCGSPLYMAPELFIPDSSLNSIENFQVDIWAFGVLVFEMFFGRRPFEAFSIEELSKMYKKGKYYINLEKNEKISKGLFNFINMCLQKDPRKRANVAKLQKSDFINQDIEPQIKSALNKEELMKQLGTSCEIDSNNNIVLDINKIYDL
jgi:serine/threonine protein kinase